MISLTGGVTGSGKTYFSNDFVLRTLENTKRLVISNINEYEIGNWQRLLDDRAAARKKKNLRPLWDDDISRRLIIIPRTDTSHYYRYRGTKTFEAFQPKEHESIEELDARLQAYFNEISATAGPGVAYVMDELHRHFRSERWNEISDAVNFHLAQHRHLDDEFWGISQNPEQIAARFNRQVHEYHHIRNHYKEQFGIFGKPGCFYIRSYYYVPKTTDRAAVPFREWSIKLDKETLGSVYRTRGALGGVNVTPETEQRRFRLPWWVIIPIALVGLTLVGFLLLQMPAFFSGFLARFIGGGASGISKLVGGHPAKQGFTNELGGSSKPDKSLVSVPLVRPMWQGRKVRSVAYRGPNRYSVTFDNGAVLTEETHLVAFVGRGGVLMVTGDLVPYMTVSELMAGHPALPAPVAAETAAKRPAPDPGP